MNEGQNAIEHVYHEFFGPLADLCFHRQTYQALFHATTFNEVYVYCICMAHDVLLLNAYGQ